jgi:hypothetical protein
MDKKAASKIAEVLRDAEEALTSITQERDKLAQKCLAYARREQAVKLASKMHDKGIRIDDSFEDLVVDLEKQAAAGDIGDIERAVDLVGPNMTIGKTNNHDDASGGTNALESFLMGTVG